MAEAKLYPGADIVNRRHIDWLENRIRWQFMLDSYEGGERYRNAVYGRDRMGLPVRNLVRHKREYPDPREFPQQSQGAYGAISGGIGADGMVGIFPGLMGADPNATAGDDDYELRRARTPPPEYVAQCVECHLAKIYDQEVDRTGPDCVMEWWKDVDGCGTPIDDWMTETVAPLLLVFGFLDVMFDHPPVPEGEDVQTQADVLRLELDRIVATYILPENMLWYRLDASKQYVECLILEYIDSADWDAQDKADKSTGGIGWAKKHIRLRHWKGNETTLYDVDGSVVEKTRPHGYGRPPIVRVFDRRKHRSAHVGKSRYEGVAEIQREVYNRSSELILSDTLQAHPLIQGPEDFISSDGTMPIGPNWLLPKKKNSNGTSTSYEGFDVIDFPKGAAESIRRNMMDLIDAKDNAAHLTKPAGAAGTSKGTVAQSGVAKQLDNDSGNKVLGKISKVLMKAENAFAEFVYRVDLDREPTPEQLEAIGIVYPSRFDLFDLDELTAGIADIQSLTASSGDLPITETLLIQATVRKLLRNLTEDDYSDIDEEIKVKVEGNAKLKGEIREGIIPRLGLTDQSNALGDHGTPDSDSEVDPSGQSNATAVSGTASTYF